MTTDHGFVRKHVPSLKLGLLAVIGITLAGCSGMAVDHGAGGVAGMEKSQTLDSGAIEEKIREVAIPVSDDLVMVPAGLDEDSCEMFKPYSANNPVKAAIHYRQADGSFDIGKDLAVCQVEMAPMGPGDDGCERYQAKPVNGGQAGDHAVTYYKKADGTYSAYKPGDSCS